MEKYTGIRPKSEAWETPNPEYSHTEKHGGKEVEYYHTWRHEWENEVRTTFGEDEEPNRAKVSAVDFIVRFMMFCGALWLIFRYIS